MWLERMHALIRRSIRRACFFPFLGGVVEKLALPDAVSPADHLDMVCAAPGLCPLLQSSSGSVHPSEVRLESAVFQEACNDDSSLDAAIPAAGVAVDHGVGDLGRHAARGRRASDGGVWIGR